MKKLILRIILLVGLIGTFFIIFGFSNQNGEESGSVSQKVSKMLVDIFIHAENLNEEIKMNFANYIQPVIRKLAHFSIYTLVGIFSMGFMSTFNLKFLKRFMTSLVVGLTYAISDEFHQSFIPGRVASAKDVCIDTLGVITGIIIVFIVISIFDVLSEKLKSKKIEKGEEV